MTQKGKYKFKKDPKQPSVTNLLQSVEREPLESTSENTSPQSSVREKRRRATNDSTDSQSPQSNRLKKDKKIPRMASSTTLDETAQLTIDNSIGPEENQTLNNPSPPINNPHKPTMESEIPETPVEMNQIIELPEGLPVTELQQMEVRLTKNMLTMLKPIQDNIRILLKTKENVEKHNTKIKRLEYENFKLTTEVNVLKRELKGVHKKISSIENKSLDRNLIVHGLAEGPKDVQEDLLTKFYEAICPTINRETLKE